MERTRINLGRAAWGAVVFAMITWAAGCASEVGELAELDVIDPGADVGPGVDSIEDLASDPRLDGETGVAPFGAPERRACVMAGVRDADRDGLADIEELFTDPCSADTDGDGVDDLLETAYDDARCEADRTACDCAVRIDCTPSRDFHVAVLPRGGDEVVRTLDFDTDFEAVDLFFLVDNSQSMQEVRATLDDALSDPLLMNGVLQSSPRALAGLGFFEDLPVGTYGSATDRPFTLAFSMSDDPHNKIPLALASQPLGNGLDAADSFDEALYQLFSGEGAEWAGVPRYREMCPTGTLGAACFRQDALPLVVHIADGCAHDGSSGNCESYALFDGAPHSWEMAMAAMDEIGGRYVGANASAESCEDPTSSASICKYMRKTAEATGARDLFGEPVLRDLLTGVDAATVRDTLLALIEDAVHRVPNDITINPVLVAGDAAGQRMLVEAAPDCDAGEPCWTAPHWMSHELAVAEVDDVAFRGTMPGSTVRYRFAFRNDRVYAGARAQRFTMRLDARAGRFPVDSQEVHILVPAAE